MGEKTTLEKIREIDPRIIYTILVIFLLIPYVRPLGIPIPISGETKAYWDFVSNIEEGSVVAIQLASDPSTIPQTRSSHQITMLKLFEKDCKILFFTLRDDAPPLHEEMMLWVKSKLPADKQPEYGVDYVNLGYLADAEATIAALVADLKGFVSEDAYGKPLNTLPMMADINTGRDFDLLVWNDGSRGIYLYALRQWQEKTGIPILIIAVSINKPGIMPYLQSKQLVGASFGVEGSAQIEYISGYIGDAIKSSEPGSLSALAITILLVFSNVVFLIQRQGGKGK